MRHAQLGETQASLSCQSVKEHISNVEEKLQKKAKMHHWKPQHWQQWTIYDAIVTGLRCRLVQDFFYAVKVSYIHTYIHTYIRTLLKWWQNVLSWQ